MVGACSPSKRPSHNPTGSISSRPAFVLDKHVDAVECNLVSSKLIGSKSVFCGNVTFVAIEYENTVLVFLK